MPLNAVDRAGIAPNGKVSYTVDQAAAQLDRYGVWWSGQLGTPATVTYAYRADAPAQMPEDTSGFSRFTQAQITGAELALEAWSDVANITFQRVGATTGGYSDNATILLGDYAKGQDGAAAFTYLPGDPSVGSQDGDLWVASNDSDNLAPSPGTYGLEVLTHELGHAIGLSHPSDYDAGDKNDSDPTYANDASYYEDSREYSIMSYFGSSNTGGQASIFAVAPQLDDIAAAQRLYGANDATRAGDTTYGFHSTADRPWYDLTSASDHIYAAIWDGGGNDTLDFSGYGQDQLIDLREGNFSNVGGDIGNVAIAVGAKIENAIGGSGNDTLYGNALANHLMGGAGNDTLAGNGGSDVLDGGAGTNTANFSGFAHDYALHLASAAGTLTHVADAAVTTLASIQNVDFTDGVLTFDLQSTAAEIVRLYDSFLGRAPDLQGFDGYLDYVAKGHSLADMAANAFASPEFQAHTASLNDTQYVTYVYETSLHRAPDAAGLSTYVADLENGTFTRTSLILQAAESPEHVALTAPLVEAGLWVPNETVEGLELLYDAAVQRQPDAYGLAQYGAEIASGTTFAQVAAQMGGSAEFQAAHANQTDAQYIESLYMAELGRQADPAGLAAYEDQLAHGVSRGQVLDETAFSQEHQSHVLAFYDPLLTG